MLHSLHAKMPPQRNVITMQEAKKYLGNWKSFIKTLYRGHSNAIPHGVFIPFTDIEELTKLQKEVRYIMVEKKDDKKPGEQSDKKKKKKPAKVKVPIYIVGVRAYYCLKMELLVPVPHPVSVSQYPVEAILVAVYQDNKRRKGSPGEFRHNPHFPTYDLLIPVPSAKDRDIAGDAGDYSIYDITQPCPPLCDHTSELH